MQLGRHVKVRRQCAPAIIVNARLRFVELKVEPQAFDELRSELDVISNFYPGFPDWFDGKFLPGLATEERRVFAIVSTENVAAIALVKCTHHEHKLCTVYVSKPYRGLGLSSALLSSVSVQFPVFELGFSVSNVNLKYFRSILKAQNFRELPSSAKDSSSSSFEHYFIRPATLLSANSPELVASYKN